MNSQPRTGEIALKPIAEQVVVLFGASSGQGRGAALEFAKRGAKVVVAARSEEGLRSLVEEIEAAGGVATYVVADAADYNQVEQVAESAVATYGRIDTWVHLAAVSIYATVEQTTPEEYAQVIQVNLLGAIHGAKAALPRLRRSGGGAIIQISSVEAEISLPYQSAYAASKHGMKGFLDTLRMEMEQEQTGISITNIEPASINTPFFEKARTKLGVMPKGAPPFYQPEAVIRSILYAAENPVAEIIVGEAGKMMVWGKRLMPGATDALLRKMGFSSQRTDTPKSTAAPDNMHEPLEGYHRVHGQFGNQSIPMDLSNWIAQRPRVRNALLGLGGVWVVRKGLRRLRR